MSFKLNNSQQLTLHLTNALEHKLAANTKKYLEIRQDANARNQ